jgi:WD40 repeat protein
LRQFQLVPSGSQGWFSRTIGGGGDHFAYASTLALYVYRLSDFTLSSVLTGHQRTITGLAWNHRNPSQFVSLGSDAKLLLWDVLEGKQLLSKTLSHNAFVADFNASNPDKLAFACEDKAVYLWDTRENTVKRLFRTGKTSARCLRWSERKTNTLAVGNKSGQIILYNTSSQATVELLAGGPEASPVADIRWDRLSADYLLVAFRDGALILIDVESRAEVQRFEKQGAAITALEWLPRQPGAFASINGRAGVIRIWNVSQRAPLEVVKVSDKPAFGMSLLPDGHSLAMTFLDGAVAIYDTATRAMRHRGLPGHIETIFDVAFHPVDADTLATASYDASVKVWNAPSMRCAQTLTADTGPLYSVSWSSDGSKIVASSGKGRTAVWDVCTGALLWLNPTAHTATCLRGGWSGPGPQKIATGGMDKTLAVWDTEHKRLVTRIPHPGDVMGCAWSPADPELIATACADGMVRLFSFRSSRPMLEVRAHASRAFNVCFSPIRASLLASSGDDGTVAIIDITTSRVSKLFGHKDKGERSA